MSVATVRFWFISLLIAVLPASLDASWFSDLTGVNIDIAAGRFQIGRPDLGALQRLPNIQDVISGLNPAGAALAFAVRQAKAQALNGAQPIPPNIYQQLRPFYPPGFLESVRFNVFTRSNVNLANATMMLNSDVGAVTLEDVVVFRLDLDAQMNRLLWAHELTHVMQYRSMGVENFSNVYSTNAWVLENQATDSANRIVNTIQGTQFSMQDFAYFRMGVNFFYGDSGRNLYPISPQTRQVLGPAVARAVMQSGQWLYVDDRNNNVIPMERIQ